MRFNFRNFLPIFIFSLSILFTACNSSGGFKSTETGLKYKFHHQNEEKQSVQLYDVVEVYMNYSSEDSILFSGGGYKIPFQVVPVYDGDLMEGILLMHLDDSATFILNTEDFFFEMMNFTEIPDHAKNSKELLFDIKIVSVSPETPSLKAQRLDLMKRKAAEADLIANYLDENKIDVSPTESGLYIIPIKNGTGTRVEDGMNVKVHYDSFFLDGRPNLSSHDKGLPVSFIPGEGIMIRAMEEAVLEMRVGDKLKLVVPSSLGYGSSDRGNIKPYTPLIFEIELIEAK